MPQNAILYIECVLVLIPADCADFKIISVGHSK